MRILIFNWKDMAHPAAGGAEVYVAALAQCWAAWGHEVTLFCASTPEASSEEDMAGVSVVRRGGRLSVYREARRYYDSQPRGRFDVVLDVVNTRPFLCPTYVDDSAVVALIFQVAREVWFYELPLPAALVGRYWLEPRWLSVYESVRVLTISDSSRASLEEYGLRRISVVPVGHEVGGPVVVPTKEEHPTVAFVGRLSPNKRPDHALRGWRLARHHLPDARMWVIGTGPMESSLRREFAAEPVQFFGRVADAEKVDLVARSHAILVTSVREGWGLVVTEAAALGTPAIGYDVPGLRDSVAASNGVVVRETIQDMGAALTKLLPGWAAGEGPLVAPGGVSSWSQVARAVLVHLEEERARVKRLGAAGR